MKFLFIFCTKLFSDFYFYIYFGLDFHTDSIARSDGISLAICFCIEKLNLNEYKDASALVNA